MATDSSSLTDDADQPTPGWKAALPFIIAVAVVVIVVGAVGIMHIVRPASDRLTEPAKVTRAINDYYTAKNALNYQNFQKASCSKDVAASGFPTQQQFADDTRAARAGNGNIVITDITETAINGTTATANVHWHYNDKPDTTIFPLTLARDGETWKVCGAPKVP
ncbi:hypothetical protein [Williamsia sp. CHRR-6]|uniref:Rv0361 family membrane protein n=1 Tax=Williamsia sp. CHRR-6 TaxID=2835871 RepID=UPI001BDABABF|nr:hypothetical protein [Williamsia sp. CHRR-6]MBT0566163.1 hypothetical protein [Williamsia sp. CHRR-6]